MCVFRLKSLTKTRVPGLRCRGCQTDTIPARTFNVETVTRPVICPRTALSPRSVPLVPWQHPQLTHDDAHTYV